MLAAIDLLAQSAPAMYFNPLKLLAAIVLFVAYALFSQWVDKDTVRVNTYKILWNLVVLAVGIVSTVTMLFVPQFLIGSLVFLVMYIIIVAVYVVHRNGLVEEQYKVLTPEHISRVMKEGFGGNKKKLIDVKERVRLLAGKKVIAIPEVQEEREQYRLAQDMLFAVLWRRAALVEIVPAGQASKITFQIDGITSEYGRPPRAEGDAIVAFLKRACGLNLEERRKPQTGQLTAVTGDNRIDLLIRTDGSAAGERLTLRCVGPEKTYKIPDLGLTDAQKDQIMELVHGGNGVTLLTATPASGLTTTTYALARSHDAFLLNIQTLEYNKEFQIENVTQHVYEPSPEKTFAADLLKIVRTDPDVIFIPEIRDKEAAKIACEAGAHKQKVYVAFQAIDPLDAIWKWLRLLGDNGLVAKSLRAVVNQRLIRKLCPECKQPYKPDAAQLRKLNLPPDKVLYRPPEPQYDKNGQPIICQNCHGTGYYGRTGVFDVAIVDDALRDVLKRAKTLAEIQSHLQKQGSGGIQAQALQKVFDGTTSIQEVVRATKPPAAKEGDGAPAPPSAPPAGGAGSAPRPQNPGSKPAQPTR
ncbi:MAG: Flp pilus assembly complex ATPase component TadA [Phycisphaerales bacterium]|nr:Flp pilus assembly complex ATPase component TadA [Phycisphaerales bacterium]